eukprot:6939046-Pyramimonas_sp.AAC.4
MVQKRPTYLVWIFSVGTDILGGMDILRKDASIQHVTVLIGYNPYNQIVGDPTTGIIPKIFYSNISYSIRSLQPIKNDPKTQPREENSHDLGRREEPQYMDLKAFIVRSKVLSLYRNSLRVANRAPAGPRGEDPTLEPYY